MPAQCRQKFVNEDPDSKIGPEPTRSNAPLRAGTAHSDGMHAQNKYTCTLHILCRPTNHKTAYQCVRPNELMDLEHSNLIQPTSLRVRRARRGKSCGTAAYGVGAALSCKGPNLATHPSLVPRLGRTAVSYVHGSLSFPEDFLQAHTHTDRRPQY